MPKPIHRLITGIAVIPVIPILLIGFAMSAATVTGDGDQVTSFDSRYGPIVFSAVVTYEVAVLIVLLLVDTLCYWLKGNWEMARHHTLWVVGIALTCAGVALYFTTSSATVSGWATAIGIPGVLTFMWASVSPKYRANRGNLIRTRVLFSAAIVGYCGVNALRTVGLPFLAVVPLLVPTLLALTLLTLIMAANTDISPWLNAET